MYGEPCRGFDPQTTSLGYWTHEIYTLSGPWSLEDLLVFSVYKRPYKTLKCIQDLIRSIEGLKFPAYVFDF